MHDGVDAIITQISQKLNSIFYDREFVLSVKEDLDIILQNDKNVCLLFPKLKPFFLKALRYQALIFGLKVFYIGEGHNRTPVVCRESLFIEETNSGCESQWTKKVCKVNKSMEEEETQVKNISKKGNRASRPTQSFYVPPARRLSKRSKPTSSTDDTSSKETKSIDTTHSTNDKEKSDLKMNHPEVVTKTVPETKIKLDMAQECLDHDLMVEENSSNNCENFTNNSLELLNINESTSDLCTKAEDESQPSSEVCEIVIKAAKAETCYTTAVSEQLTNLSIDTIKNESAHETLLLNKDDTPIKSHTKTDFYISYSSNNTQTLKDETDNETRKIQRTMENINRRSKPLIKHVQTDDTLQIDTNSKHTNSYYSNNRNRFQCYKENVVEENHSNWEDMFDESGELRKKYVGEIAKHTACEVEIIKATNDYSSYQNILQDLEHVIELYDFPSSFKTQDLIQLYSDAYQDTVYVKWCDDTHALLVLSTPAQAKRALRIEHDIIKSRPLVEGSKVATLVANCSDLKPAMKRPPTNMQTARRLINSHLGTKVTLSKEVMEQERKALMNAREQKRLERQNEKDAWEGNPRNNK